MFGWVITRNTIPGKGFFSPFPGLVVKIHDRVCGSGWDHWSYREEMYFRRTGEFLKF